MNLVGRTVAAVAVITAVALAVPGGVAYVAVHQSLVDAATDATRSRVEQLAGMASALLQQADERARSLSRDRDVENFIANRVSEPLPSMESILPILTAAARFDAPGAGHLPAGVFLADTRGRPLLEIGKTAPHALAEADWLSRVVGEGRPGIELDRNGRTIQAVLIAYPVFAAAADVAAGALVFRVPSDVIIGETAIGGTSSVVITEAAAARADGPGTAEAIRAGRQAAAPLRLAGAWATRPLLLAAEIDRTAADAAARQLLTALLAIAACVEICVVGLGFVAARRIVRSGHEFALLADAIENIDSADGSIGVAANAPDGVLRIADSVNAMLNRLRDGSDAERSTAEARYRAVFDALDEGLITMRPDGIVVSANRAALRMFGCDASEMVGRRFRVATAASKMSRHDGLDGFLRTGEANMAGKTRKLVGRRKDGAEVPIEMSITETSMHGQNLITGVLRDLSERKQAERALRSAQAEARKLALVASRTQNIVIIMDAAGKIEWVNEAFARLTGHALEESAGASLGALLHGPDSDPAETSKIDAAVKAGQGFRTEIGGLSKSRNRYWVEIDGQPVLDRSGRPSNFIAVGSDITVRKESEAELRKARDRAEDASRAKSEFLSTVSHELRTPLTSISGALGLIRAGVAGELPPKMKSMLDIAANNCERLMQIINDILDVQKIEAGKMDYRMRRVNLAELVRESVEANRTYGRNNKVELIVGEVDENSTVTGDADRLMQVMANLISNAVKFSPPQGQVEVTVARRQAMFRITVEDHGAGIPEEFRSRIFQKFWQANSSDTRKQGGTGLGLAITKALVEHHEGRISFESVVGQGTKFHVDLPADRAAAGRPPRGEQAPKARGAAP